MAEDFTGLEFGFATRAIHAGQEPDPMLSVEGLTAWLPIFFLTWGSA